MDPGHHFGKEGFSMLLRWKLFKVRVQRGSGNMQKEKGSEYAPLSTI
jgi:hypothetical protein